MSQDIKKKLDRVFNPRTVAVVGDKQMNNYMWLRNMTSFRGKAYSVQIDPNEIPGIEALGFDNYYSLLDIPEPIDYVIVAVPREVAPKIIADCIKKQVGGVTLFTAGFAETGTEDGIRLQKRITDMAKEAGLSLIGPNCMGIFNPKIGLRNGFNQYYGEGGPVGFVSQSGTHSIWFSLVGALHGIKISKSVSYGNAVVLDSTDYLEYLAQDEETKVIGMYIEGVKDGRRFFKLLREVTPKKPVLIWKGGQTEEGQRATASHTASLAESPVIWEALIKQCGAIKVDSLDEMVDVTKALLYLKPTTGNRVGLIAMTGGQSVVITDTFAKAGLRVPLLTEASYREFASFFNIIGSSYRNPLDISSNFGSVELLMRMVDILGRDENIDSVVLELSMAFLAIIRQRAEKFLDDLLDALTNFKDRSEKPFLTILIPGPEETAALETRARLVERGIACFPDFARGANALRKVIDYYCFHSTSGELSHGEKEL